MAITRPVSHDVVGTGFSQLLIALATGGGATFAALDAARECRTQPGVAIAMEKLLAIEHGKSDVPGGSLSNEPWIGSLGEVGLGREVAQLFDARSILAALEPRALAADFMVKVLAQTASGISGGWHQEGHTTAVYGEQLTAGPVLMPTRVETITLIPKDTIRFGGPRAEKIIRDALTRSLAWRVDTCLLDPAVVTPPGCPGSITAGAPVIAGTGTNGMVTAADLETMFTTITTSGAGLVWIAAPQTLGRVLLAADRSEAPGLLAGVPVLISGNVPAGVLILFDAAELVLASGGFSISLSLEAAVEQSDTPVGDVTTPTPSASQVSLWQTHMIGYLFTKYVNWQLAHAGGVCYAQLP
jgi:hypothetical protein